MYTISKEEYGDFLITSESSSKTLGSCTTKELIELIHEGEVERNNDDCLLGKIKLMLAYAELLWRKSDTGNTKISKDASGNFLIHKGKMKLFSRQYSNHYLKVLLNMVLD